ncbi:hypothetical protein V6U90_17165 [Micromonospora sp. CPCC 206060]|uniref:hypothetical protein n=1 Tax=Micromonospora sp. CPCC 206060 TaxID=3122406 RepID=UPI002FF32DF7
MQVDHTKKPSLADDQRSGSRKAVGWIVGIQAYLLASYAAASIVPYAWNPRPYPSTWLWIVPGWLLGLPGYVVAMLGWPIFAAAGLIGAMLLFRQRDNLAAGRWRWLMVTTLLTLVGAVFVMTPFGLHLKGWTLD